MTHFDRIERMIVGQKANGGPNKLAKGKEITSEYLRELPSRHDWFDVRVADEDIAKQMELIKPHELERFSYPLLLGQFAIEHQCCAPHLRQQYQWIRFRMQYPHQDLYPIQYERCDLDFLVHLYALQKNLQLLQYLHQHGR